MKKYLIFAIILCCFSLAQGQFVSFSPQQFNDETWRVFDNNDPTKGVRFELSSLTTATTRTLTIPDFNMTFIDWTAATENLYTTGFGRFDGGIGVGKDPTGAGFYLANAIIYEYSDFLVLAGDLSILPSPDRSILVPIIAGKGFYYGSGGTEHHKFGDTGQVEISDDGLITAVTYNALTLASAADGFTIAGGTTERTLTVTGGNWTLDQSVASGANVILGTIASGRQTVTGDATHGVRINQGADAKGLEVYGYDDESGIYIKTYINASAGIVLCNGNISWQTTGGKYIYFLSTDHIYMNLGDAAGAKHFYLRDSASQVVMDVDSDGNIDASGTIRTTADQDWNLGAASAQADFAGDTKIRVTIDGNDFDIVALAI